MFAINHAATALLVKRRFPAAALVPVLISVQAMELAWVVLNYVGIERTTTGPVVRDVTDIHLASMPYSHSVAVAAGISLFVWLLLEKGLNRAVLGRAVGVGILSHLVLDLLTHGHDIVLWPVFSSPRLGLGLYSAAPIGAFILELSYGVVCWVLYRGSRSLLALVVLGNVANISLFVSGVAGPESYLAGRPLLVVTLVAAQIVVTIPLVGVCARRPPAVAAEAGA